LLYNLFVNTGGSGVSSARLFSEAVFFRSTHNTIRTEHLVSLCRKPCTSHGGRTTTPERTLAVRNSKPAQVRFLKDIAENHHAQSPADITAISSASEAQDDRVNVNATDADVTKEILDDLRCRF